MGRFRDRRYRHDRFYRKAKQERFASRAVYKLQTLDERFDLIRPGDRVLDLGCWPGGWLQYCADRTGADGRVVGIDRKALSIALPPHVRVLQGDVRQTPVASLLGDLKGFDLVISDMAPDTTGIRFTDVARSVALVERALEIATATVPPGGHFVAKVFVGSGFDDLLGQIKRVFCRVKIAKPEASRKQSMEQYIVARERRVAAEAAGAPDDTV